MAPDPDLWGRSPEKDGAVLSPPATPWPYSSHTGLPAAPHMSRSAAPAVPSAQMILPRTSGAASSPSGPRVIDTPIPAALCVK